MKLVIFMVYFNLTLGLRLPQFRTNDPQKPLDFDLVSDEVIGLDSCDSVSDSYDEDCANLDQGLVKEFPELNVIQDIDTNITQVPDRFQGVLVYVKVSKVGGSTWGGIMRRIGERHGLKHTRDTTCEAASVCANHGKADKFQRLKDAIFISLIRDPVDRSMSRFYHFRVLRKNDKPTDENKIKHLKNEKANHQTQYISKSQFHTPAEIVESYAFIGLTERFDESLLLLQNKFGLDRGDLLYLKAKESGHPATDRSDRGKNMPTHRPFEEESAAVKEAASHLQRGQDAELKRLVNAALDKAIGEYGPTFQQDLQEFQTKLRQLEDACRPHFFESCLWNDNGCAQKCIDQLL